MNGRQSCMAEGVRRAPRRTSDYASRCPLRERGDLIIKGDTELDSELDLRASISDGVQCAASDPRPIPVIHEEDARPFKGPDDCNRTVVLVSFSMRFVGDNLESATLLSLYLLAVYDSAFPSSVTRVLTLSSSP